MDQSIHSVYPILPLRSTVLFPATALPLSAGRPKSLAAIRAAIASGQWLCIVAQKHSLEGRDVNADDLYRTGVVAKIEKVNGSEKDSYQILVRGIARFQINAIHEKDGYLEAEGSIRKDEMDVDPATETALLSSLKNLAREILELLSGETKQLAELVEGIDDLSLLSNLCAANLDLPVEKTQDLLETISIRTRSLKLLDYLQARKEGLELQHNIQDKMSRKLSKTHREHLLREQLRTIREELGEEGGEKSPDGYRQKIEESGMPEDAKKVALDELKRLDSLGSSSPEAPMIRNYLDLLVALPWSKGADATIELDKAREVLNQDHYGLDKIKARVLQYLAVMKLKKENTGQILLFVGPPGVGKTSLGQSIAKALGRKFARTSLGGVRDDAEIRGHRRTYIGAMPGRIIQSIKRAGENNPVMLLDEIDKMGRGFQGDPAGALLEVLDPEQNSKFMDHYLDLPFDLSKVFFIATANTLETIPPALLDRMEIIELSGYTTAEKFHIGKNHLLPKQLQNHGLNNQQLQISDEALLRVINFYTREAGVRELQRKIAEICRANTEKVLDASVPQPILVAENMLETLIGPERYVHEVAERLAPPGVVTGLAWTPVGGEILFIEASLMPGTGNLTLTGQLGDVMKESAQIALSLVRSKLPSLVPSFEYNKRDLHVHVPGGAVPKDGPSAGLAMLATIASLFSGKSIDPKTAMTGEITLRGAVLPVGGIKEKVIAAHRAGITKVILSKRNEKDLRDVPEDVRTQLKFVLVETADEAFIELGLNSAKTEPAISTPSEVFPPMAS